MSCSASQSRLAWDELLPRLRAAAGPLERSGQWPGEQLGWLADAGVLKIGIPEESGGAGTDADQLLRAYVDLADACLVTTFVLTQRNAAVQRIVAADGPALQAQLLPALARGELFATVGISHLTTSRQHLQRPAVQVRRDFGEIVLSGDVPWVTGGAQADFIVTGGVDDQGQQWLIALPADARGVACDPPARLLALTAAHTGGVRLEDVRIPSRYVLAGPEERVLQRGTGAGTGSLGTSALAAGLSRRAVALLGEEARQRPDLEPVHAGLVAEVGRLIQDLFAAAQGASPTCGTPESIRERANALALRSTQALLAASKGAGFVAGHPAEQAVREAMFFLVWSCPQPVVAAALRGFACLAD